MKQPSMQFYPGDWMKDPAVRSMTLACRGLWMDLICLMWECNPRGYLQHADGRPWTHAEIARATGGPSNHISALLTPLVNGGTLSVTQNGVYYCRRMVRDEQLRRTRSECGKRGGNPILLNQNPTPSSSSSSSTTSRTEIIQENQYHSGEQKQRAREPVTETKTLEDELPGKRYQPSDETVRKAFAEYPGSTNPETDLRLFLSVIQTPDDERLYFSNTKLYRDCRRVRDGYAKSFKNYLTERMWKHPPDDMQPKTRSKTEEFEEIFKQRVQEEIQNGKLGKRFRPSGEPAGDVAVLPVRSIGAR